MQTRLVCLANSYKEGGRCLAGIELDNDNKAVLQNGQPKWIRPVCKTPHGEVPTYIAEPFKLLDIIEIEITSNRPEGYQSENVLFEEKSMRTIGVLNKNQLGNLCENKKYVFATRYSSLPEEVIQELNHSLMLIQPSSVEVTERIYEDRPDRPQQRLAFLYNGFQYDFSITDPAFLKEYQKNPNFFKKVKEVFLCLSLGIKFPVTNKYYKLVAGIIY